MDRMSSKDRVLGILLKSAGEYVSGEAIADSLMISRNAVWKAIGLLKREGYHIEAATRRGYRLKGGSDQLHEGSILLAADSPDLKLHIFGTIDSTNRKAKEMALLGAPHGTAVAADSQSEGSGRHMRKFFSPGGGIYLSVILRPRRMSFTDPEGVTAYAAVSVRKAILESTGKAARIKPVNDLFIGDRKLSGILTESISDFESGEIGWIVVGIGVNYRLKREEIPADIRDKVISLYGEEENGTPRDIIIGAILRHLLAEEITKSRDEILKEYSRYVL